MKFYQTFIVLAIIFYSTQIAAQPQKPIIIDEVVAVVGNKSILFSEVEAQLVQYKIQMGNSDISPEIRCQIIETLLLNKLMITQAQLDSLIISDAQIEERIERNMKYFISQFGSRSKLEEYYKKNIDQIKEELRDPVRDQLTVEMMQENITKSITVTPSEIKKYLSTIPKDSLPTIPSEYEFNEIVIIPIISQDQVNYLKEKLNGFRERILKGESFATLAVLYSEDKGSAIKGGELGFVSRGELYPEFESVAFSLKPGEISSIIKSKAGYHIIQMIERRGENINVRHILLQPQASTQELINSSNKLDSINNLIKQGVISFKEAAKKYSDAPTKVNFGAMINPYTGSVRFDVNQIDPSISKSIETMKIGDISAISAFRTEEGSQAFRIAQLNYKTEPHIANLIDDYDKIQRVALENKKQKTLETWITTKLIDIYVKLSDEYKDCKFQNKWYKN